MINYKNSKKGKHNDKILLGQSLMFDGLKDARFSAVFTKNRDFEYSRMLAVFLQFRWNDH